MVLLPGCSCCSGGCPRLCTNVRYVSFRFQLAAGSGDPFANLPLMAFSGYDPVTFDPIYDTPWYPPLTPNRTVSWPDIDETIVIDLTQTPTRVDGAYSFAEATAFTDAAGNFIECRLVASMSYSLNLFQWPIFRNSATLGLVYDRMATATEVTSAGVSSAVLGRDFPYIASESAINNFGPGTGGNFRIGYGSGWQGPSEGGGGTGFTGVAVSNREPAVYRDCQSQPGDWTEVSSSSSGVQQGSEYTMPLFISNGNFTNYHPYESRASPPWVMVDTSGPPRFRRLMPYPTMTITTT